MVNVKTESTETLLIELANPECYTQVEVALELQNRFYNYEDEIAEANLEIEYLEATLKSETMTLNRESEIAIGLSDAIRNSDTIEAAREIANSI